MKRSAFVWAVGLDATGSVSERCEIFEGIGAYGRFDCAFPVEETGVVIADRETLDGPFERQAGE